MKISNYDDKKIIVTIAVVIVALTVDTFFLKVYDLYSKDPTFSLRIFVFIIISLIYCIGQYVLLKYVKFESKEIRILETLHFNVLHNIVTIVQYILTAILVYVIIQIVMTSKYSTVSISIAITISCMLACSMLVILTQRFFSWFKTNRDHIVFLYGLSSAVLAITTVILFVFVDMVLWSTKPDSIMPKVGGTGLFIAPGTINGLLDYTYIIFFILSFILTWLATSMLLRNHFQKIGRVKYSIAVGIPLIYFTSQFFSLFFDIFVPLLRSDPVFYGILLTFIFTFSKLVGGIFFGIAFWIVARSISPDNIVRKYMIISAYGLILLFVSNQVNGIIVTSYPPFGLMTTLFIGLSSYLILIGVYATAISIAQDSKLRKSIRQNALDESKLLMSIGSAQMQLEIENRVSASMKKQQQSMSEDTGVQSSLTDQDVKEHVALILKEISIVRNTNEILNKAKDILNLSNEFLICSKSSGIRFAYKNYFEIYEKVMQRYRAGEHEGIRLVTYINGEDVPIIKEFLSIGVQIRHLKNMPPIDFAVSDKETISTIQNTEQQVADGQIIQNQFVADEKSYIMHFVSIFEELWKNGMNAKNRIEDIEKGINSEA